MFLRVTKRMEEKLVAMNRPVQPQPLVVDRHAILVAEVVVEEEGVDVEVDVAVEEGEGEEDVVVAVAQRWINN